MQLNPARGRKLVIAFVYLSYQCLLGLCSSTPRGDGNTSVSTSEGSRSSTRGLCSSTPRGDGNKELNPTHDPNPHGLCSSTPRGDGNARTLEECCLPLAWVYAAQPREGTETRVVECHREHASSRFMQLNPARGRKHMYRVWQTFGYAKVYAAQPREGTETAKWQKEAKL